MAAPPASAAALRQLLQQHIAAGSVIFIDGSIIHTDWAAVVWDEPPFPFHGTFGDGSDAESEDSLPA